MIVCDIDGTLTKDDGKNNCLGHTTFENIKQIMDPVRIAKLEPRQEMIDRINNLANRNELIVLITGRWEFLLEVTQSWLMTYKVKYHGLVMRDAGEWRLPSVDVKLRALEQAVEHYGTCSLWLDDDPMMIAALKDIDVRGELV